MYKKALDPQIHTPAVYVEKLLEATELCLNRHRIIIGATMPGHFVCVYWQCGHHVAFFMCRECPRSQIIVQNSCGSHGAIVHVCTE